MEEGIDFGTSKAKVRQRERERERERQAATSLIQENMMQIDLSLKIADEEGGEDFPVDEQKEEREDDNKDKVGDDEQQEASSSQQSIQEILKTDEVHE